MHVDVFVGEDLGAHHILMAFGDEPLYLLGRKRQRVAHLHTGGSVVLEVGDLFAFRLQLGGRVERDVGMVVGKELIDILLIDLATLALAIRTIVASEANAFVELDAEPGQRLDDVGFGSGHEAARVGVLDAEDQVSTMLFSK